MSSVKSTHFFFVSFFTALVYFWDEDVKPYRGIQHFLPNSSFCFRSVCKSVFVLVQPDLMVVCQEFVTFFILFNASAFWVPQGIHTGSFSHCKWLCISWLFSSLAVSKSWPQLRFGLLVTCVAASFHHWWYCRFTAFPELVDQYIYFPNH